MLDTEAEPKMRKRSKYRPKGVIKNTMAYLMEGMVPMREHKDRYMTLKISNHAALAALVQGRATKQDVEELIGAFNISEALYTMGMGREYGTLLQDAQKSLMEIGARGLATNKFMGTGPQLNNIKLMMELHDAQLDLCTVNDLDAALLRIRKLEAKGEVKRIRAADHPTTGGYSSQSNEISSSTTTTDDGSC